MGAVCCCFGIRDMSTHGDGNHHSNGNCQCLSCSFQNFMNQCRDIFDTESGHAAPMSNQGVVSSDSVVVHNTSSATNGSSDRSLPSNANSRYSLVPQEVEIRIQDKVSSHSCAEPEPLRNSGGEVMPKVLRIEKKLVDPYCEKESGGRCPESSMSFLSSKVEHESGYYGFSSSEDEDVCPTCLEEYTPENPKIVTKCSHHYHLSCIYEWMERSETCPVCGRLTVLGDESGQEKLWQRLQRRNILIQSVNVVRRDTLTQGYHGKKKPKTDKN